MNTVRKGKQNRHEKITVVLLSGKSVSPTEIREVFKGTDQESVLYRLSTNIYNIRKDGGIIRVHKNGREVTGYQLINFTEFNAEGRYIGKAKTPSPSGIDVQTTDNSYTESVETETVAA
jgi:hypothetical protein